MQAAIIGSTVTGMAVSGNYLVKSLAKALGRQTSTVIAGMGASVVGLVLMRKLAGYLRPGMEPATTDKVNT